MPPSNNKENKNIKYSLRNERASTAVSKGSVEGIKNLAIKTPSIASNMPAREFGREITNSSLADNFKKGPQPKNKVWKMSNLIVHRNWLKLVKEEKGTLDKTYKKIEFLLVKRKYNRITSSNNLWKKTFRKSRDKWTQENWSLNCDKS
jgi:hypothetical protein